VASFSIPKYASFLLRFCSLKDCFQVRREIKEMMIGPRAQAAGIVYLSSEAHAFQAKEGRRIWSVYGSPVSLY
jgi:hypothetical protein